MVNNGHDPKIQINQWFDIQDTNGRWYEAQVRTVEGDRFLIHYKGWKPRFDEWFDINVSAHTNRIAPLNVMTKPGAPPDPQVVANLNVGQIFDCCDTQGKWFQVKILEVGRTQCLVHYLDWGTKYDEWLDHDTWRLQLKDTFVGKAKKRTKKERKKRQKRKRPAPIVHTNTPKPQAPSWLGFETINNNTKNEILEKTIKNQTKETDISFNDEVYDVKNQDFSNSQVNGIAQAEISFRRCLSQERNFIIVNMGEDGNCLFRSVSHQVYGTQDNHKLVRQKCVEYMVLESFYFCNYVEGDEEFFERYCNRMALDGVWGGNIEIQAMSELYQRPIEIYAYSTKPMKTYSNQFTSPASPIRLSYHQKKHYNSVSGKQRNRNKIYPKPGDSEDRQLKWSKLRSKRALEEALEASEMDQLDENILAQALRSSRQAFEANFSEDDALFEQAVKASKAYLKQQQEDALKEILRKSALEKEAEDLKAALEQSASEANHDEMQIDDDSHLIDLLVSEGHSLDSVTALYNSCSISDPSIKLAYMRSVLDS